MPAATVNPVVLAPLPAPPAVPGPFGVGLSPELLKVCSVSAVAGPVVTAPVMPTVSTCPVASANVCEPTVTDTLSAAQATHTTDVLPPMNDSNPIVPRTAICEVAVIKR